MQIRVLGCSGGIAAGCRTTAFLVDEDLLVDAGTGLGDLSLDELARLADVNDRAAAQASLDGELHHWRDGTPIRCRAWLEAALEELAPLAAELGLTTVLAPLKAVIRTGNQAMVWLERHRRGEAIAAIIAADAAALEVEERRQSVWLQAEGADALG